MWQLDDNLVERFMWYDELGGLGFELEVNEWYDDIVDAYIDCIGFGETLHKENNE